MDQQKSTVDRRSFLSSAAILGASGAIGASGLLYGCSGGADRERLTPLRSESEYHVPTELPDKAIDGKPLKAALIGCGERGTGSAFDFISAANDVSVVACADILQDRMDRCRRRLKEHRNNEIADEMCFIGFDAYKTVCDMPDVDVILIASPSLFHSVHVAYAIEKGKHVFCEKPASIDAAGYRAFMTAVRQAQAGKQCIVTGTQRHHNRGYIESYKKIQEGYIGRITSANLYWNQRHGNFARRRPEWTDMEYMYRDFFSWNWLCGDHVIDQLVHNVDVFTWFSHLKPVKVIGMGSRQRRLTGDVYDNFSVDIEYEGRVHVHAMARQIDDCDNLICEIIQGTKGSWDSRGHIIRDIDGNEIWKYDDEAAKEIYTQHNPYILEHVDLVNNIRKGTVVNFAETTAIASMACTMARESAYTGKTFTWDEMTMSDLNFLPEELHLGNTDMSKYAVPVPGAAPPM